MMRASARAPVSFIFVTNSKNKGQKNVHDADI